MFSRLGAIRSALLGFPCLTHRRRHQCELWSLRASKNTGQDCLATASERPVTKPSLSEIDNFLYHLYHIQSNPIQPQQPNLPTFEVQPTQPTTIHSFIHHLHLYSYSDISICQISQNRPKTHKEGAKLYRITTYTGHTTLPKNSFRC